MLLKIGNRGGAVAHLQRDLNELGAAGDFPLPKVLDDDGIYGDLTASAVIRFQRAHGIGVDGIAGDETLGSIAEAQRRRSTPPDAIPAQSSDRATLAQKFLAIAQKEVGTREVGGNNCGVRIREYQRATDETPGVWPWCAAFVCWCLRDWTAQPDVQAALGWADTGEKNRAKTASAFGFIDWARTHRQIVLPPTTRPEPGMLAIYRFSHIGIVKAALDGDSFLAIEGNTNGRGERDSEGGDGVWEKRRSGDLVLKFIAWNFVAQPTPAEKSAAPALPADVLPAMRGVGAIPRECLEFIVDKEGMDQPWIFPGGSSGVTLGHGYDLGAEPAFAEEWKDWLTPTQIQKLSAALGRSGPKAEALCPQFKSIKITTEAADDVFYRFTIPKYYELMAGAFPRVGEFPGEVQGAILSLVFNRGAATKGPNREEMAEIQGFLANGPIDARTLGRIATSLRDMKRLWVGKGLNGLIARREDEARMVESAIV